MTAKHLTYTEARRVRSQWGTDRKQSLNMPLLLTTGAKLCRIDCTAKPCYMVLGYAQDGRDVQPILESLKTGGK